MRIINQLSRQSIKCRNADHTPLFSDNENERLLWPSRCVSSSADAILSTELFRAQMLHCPVVVLNSAEILWRRGFKSHCQISFKWSLTGDDERAVGPGNWIRFDCAILSATNSHSVAVGQTIWMRRRGGGGGGGDRHIWSFSRLKSPCLNDRLAG